MLLSDAIRLGSLTLKPVAGVRWADGGDSGCAIGMAEFAAFGKNRYHCDRLISLREGQVVGTMEHRWPWTAKDGHLYPCGCGSRNGQKGSVVSCIAHTFNQHVMGDHIWTLDRLCEWVASVEPADAAVAPETTTAPSTELVHAL